MSWNYRIIYHPPSKIKVGDKIFKQEEYLAIHEVYYDENNNPDGVTEDCILSGDEGKDSGLSLKWKLEQMKNALNKPILNFEELTEIEKEKQNEFSKSIKNEKENGRKN